MRTMMRKIELYFSEKLKYTIFHFWDIVVLLVMMLAISMIISYSLLKTIDSIIIPPGIQIVLFALIMMGVWIGLFKVTKKYLLKWKCIIIKEELDKIFSCITCLGLICTVMLSIAYLGEQVDINNQFVDKFLMVVFGTMPSALIKSFFINDKRLVQERKNVYRTRRNRFYFRK